MSDHETESIPTGEARKRLSDLVSEALYRKTRVRLSRHGKDCAAIVPIEDLEFLQEIEDRMDVAIARERLASEETVPWDELVEALRGDGVK